jgi:N-acetyl-anhydromuramyl-L-alanine amidase AmpD
MALSRGAKGADVAEAQMRLVAHGFATGTDGLFGPDTERKVRAFQTARGLSATGTVDAATMDALRAAPPFVESAGLVIAGARVPVTGVEVVTWLDDPKVPRAMDGKSRRADAVKAIVIHTVHGKVGPLADHGSAPSDRAERYARYQSSTSRDVSWHLTIDTDGTVVQSADVATWTCWHATSVNPWTVGIELVQESDGTIYRPQLDVLVWVCEVLCDHFGIPHRVPARNGVPTVGVVERLTGKHGSWGGVFGHRNQTTNRGVGDPGDHVFRALLAAGYAGVEP